MKAVLIILFSLIHFSANANDLTSHQESDVLTAIDNICGDTWCEGDFDYSFNAISCDFKTATCKFEFDYIWYEFDEEYEEILETITIPHTCELTGVESLSYMLEDSNYLDLKWEFYHTVGDCISDGEDQAYDQID